MVTRSISLVPLVLAAFLMLLPEDVSAQRGGRSGISRSGGGRSSIGRSGGGGGRSSFGGRSRSSFGGRSRSSFSGRSRSSFGGSSRSSSGSRTRSSVGSRSRSTLGSSRGLSSRSRSSGLSSRGSVGSSRSRNSGFARSGSLRLGTTRTTPSRSGGRLSTGGIGSIRGRGATSSTSRSSSTRRGGSSAARGSTLSRSGRSGTISGRGATSGRSSSSTRGTTGGRRSVSEGRSGRGGASAATRGATGERGIGGSRTGRRREGFTGFQSGRRDQNYRASSSYRADVARRTGATRSNWNGYDGGHHHHHHYYGGYGRRRFFGFGFGFGYGYGGFGFGFGYGRFNSFYARVFWGYPYSYWPYFGNAFYYPCWGYGYYPYFSSYSFFPIQRTVYIYDGGLRATGGSWAGRGYDDPYVEPEAPPGEEAPLDLGEDVEETSGVSPLEPIDAASADDGTQVLASPLVDDVETYGDAESARTAGDRYLRDGWGMKAAEAYRQAWRREPTDDTTLRLAAALLDGGDYPLAGWALVRGVGATEKRVLDFTVLLDDLLGGSRITRATQSLEKYLVGNPNDEGSNLLLGALYVVTGREYAGYVVLSRLRAAEYETATVDLFIAQARTVIGQGR